MKILVIDGMGGGIGKLLIERLREARTNVEITAVGTNSVATAAMLKAGADNGATGENAVIYNSGQVEFIVGVVGIAFANSMHGEVSPAMAQAVSQSEAHKILIPMERSNVTLIGVSTAPILSYINEVVEKFSAIC
jgi:hypothetical protein